MPDQLQTHAARTDTADEQIAEAVALNAMMLRTVLERLDDLIQLLTPKPSDGPTLDELLARLVSLVTDQLVVLKRIDDGTALLIANSGAGDKVLQR